jgi:hypothetical protein
VDWFRAVNRYCERTDASYWSEPVNALSNAAFLVVALVVWPAARRAGDRAAQALCLVLALPSAPSSFTPTPRSGR